MDIPFSKTPSRRTVFGLQVLSPPKPKLIGIAADHGGYDLKQHLLGTLRESGYEVIDFGDRKPRADDDYPDFVLPLARAVAAGGVERGIAICRSGVGVSILSNKVPGVRASLIHETFSARQGVEDEDMNLICLGGQVIGHSLAWELIQTFLAARFSRAPRHRRRLAMFAELETSHSSPKGEKEGKATPTGFEPVPPP